MKTLINGGTLISEHRCFEGYLIVEGERIVDVGEGEYCGAMDNLEVVDARGCLVLPGVIDDQVHFRDPGLTYKADTLSESTAAAMGGVTSFMDMPNTRPATTTLEALEQKFDSAAERSLINYSYYFGVTNDNSHLLAKLDTARVCGVKLFMGSSTGNMLVDREETLREIFDISPVLVAAHCEDEATIRANTDHYKNLYGDSATAALHHKIRSSEACYRSTAKAVGLAERYGARLHILHLSSERELSLFDSCPLEQKRITNEVCVHHLWFSAEDYALKGNLIKWNPAIKGIEDRDALRCGLTNGKVDIVATDHAPHTLEEKMRPYFDAPSGGPMVQHSLVAMLQLAEQGLLSVGQVVEKMCHAPARLFGIVDRGYLRKGYYADIAIVKREPWQVCKDNIGYKCGWSPLEGSLFDYRVVRTIVNGTTVYDGAEVIHASAARELRFNR